MPGKGPGLHLSMYRHFLIGDDEPGAGGRQPGRVSERSEP
jgi:hypothetical protein